MSAPDFKTLDRKRILKQLQTQLNGALEPDELQVVLANATYAIALGLDSCADALSDIRDALKAQK